MTVTESAPSNIALIKYMGKLSAQENIPTNSSLSYTLESLRTFVEIKAHPKSEDCWEPLSGPGLEAIELSSAGQKKFLGFFEKLKKQFGISGQYLVRSANTFPSDAGLASSASSFAALTKCAYKVAVGMRGREFLSNKELADLSRLGSGSSCRSFFSPWAIWDHKGVREGDPLLPHDLKHLVLVVNSDKKTVSSSEAHSKVISSLLFEGRTARAEVRLKRLTDNLKQHKNNCWKEAFEIIWAEFWDMHALFETAHPPFGFLLPQTLDLLLQVRKDWDEIGDGPLVTLDAGPNIHLLFRGDQKDLYLMTSEKMKRQVRVVGSF